MAHVGDSRQRRLQVDYDTFGLLDCDSLNQRCSNYQRWTDFGVQDQELAFAAFQLAFLIGELPESS